MFWILKKNPSIRRFLRQFRNDRSGVVALLFALCLVPFLGLVALSVDYGYALMVRTQLNNAADAAALAAITGSKAYVLAHSDASTDEVKTAGETAGCQAFKANAGDKYKLLTNTTGANSCPSIDMDTSGTNLLTMTITANVTYTAKFDTYFMGIFNYNSLNVSSTSSSSLTMASYVNYFNLIDVSGSMGIPSTTDGQNTLAAINPDDSAEYTGCVFACHMDQGNIKTTKTCSNKVTSKGKTTTQNQACQGYTLTRNGGNSKNTPVSYCPEAGLSYCIQLRLDAVTYALQQFMTTAQNTEAESGVTGEFAVGLYPFITNMADLMPGQSTNLTSVSTKSTTIPSMLDDGSQTNTAGSLGSGGTHFDNALSQIKTKIQSVGIGDGSAQDSRKTFVFLITDGVNDRQYYYTGGSGFNGDNYVSTIDTSYCTSIKNMGTQTNPVYIFVLYVPYVPIQNPNTSFSSNEDGRTNALLQPTDQAAAALQSCATPGYYWTASDPDAINAAIQAMFAASLQLARLTK